MPKISRERDQPPEERGCYTTGTTGRPKGIYYSHRGIYLHTMAEVTALGMRSDDTVLLIAPMFHGQCWGLPQAAVLAAAKIVLPGRYTADEPGVLVDAMIAEQVTVANGAPATSSSPTGSRMSSKAAASGSPPSTWKTPSPATTPTSTPAPSA